MASECDMLRGGASGGVGGVEVSATSSETSSPRRRPSSTTDPPYDSSAPSTTLLEDELVDRGALEAFCNQVAGHGVFLKLGSRRVAKPVIPREVAFYTNCRTSVPLLLPFLAKFYGTVMVQEQDGQAPKSYLILEDLTRAYRKPCILDLKMGTRTWADTASKAKREIMKARCEATTSLQLGLRICGIRTYNASTKAYEEYDKVFGRSLDGNTILDAFKSYIQENVRVIAPFVQRIERLAHIMPKITSHRFYASSLLLVFEGDPDEETKCDVRMIDFANTNPVAKGEEGVDTGYILGLTNLLRLLHDTQKSIEAE